VKAQIVAVETPDSIPTTWVTSSCLTCQEGWTVDTTEFDPVLTLSDVEEMLMPLMEDHTEEHQR
jgi:hypothetical protein